MDSKKKQPAKKMGKKQFKNYTLLNGVPITDMPKEQLENHFLQLQQVVEHEREERNYYQLERDKIQLFWEVTKQQMEEKDALLQLKDSEVDEAALNHLAEIKLFKQKMKHIMFECQQYIDERMKEKTSEKLILEEEHLVEVNHLEDEANKLKDQFFQLQIDNGNAIINQRLKHAEDLCSLHQQYQKETDILKSKEVAEIGAIRHRLERDREKAIQEIQKKKDMHIEHLIQMHEEMFQQMKNYYNDIIKNDILLIKSLKDKIKDLLRKECHYIETIKNLEAKNDVLSSAFNDFLQIKSRHLKKVDSKDVFYQTVDGVPNISSHFVNDHWKRRNSW
ncbi:dynein regulatory complex subunit 4-like isoform X2 [Argiope bruennichi]|uniref:dynein regulatory complex subunit 4-like isoform X2 n=1 Tax=Argiope bruennichi TaxID=94029 RepID=UPI0024953939|nr:dynein regulatory complex subunit 4-like isoform X2 [Argiope bruennichi]